MKSFPAAQIPLIERPHSEPLYFAHIYLTGETLYFSDRNFKFNGHEYEAYLLDIPGTVHSIEQTGGYRNIDASLTFWNKPFRSYAKLIDFFIANPLTRKEMELFVLYLDKGQIPETDVSTKLHRLGFGEIDDIRTETFKLGLSSILHLLDRKKLFTQINRTNWPNAAPNAIGKYENRSIGPMRDVACHCVVTGAVSTLAQDAAANATEIYLTETDYPIAFPSSGQVQIGFCIVTYTGKNSTDKKLTGCTWSIPARAKKKGEPVWEIRSSYKYLADGGKLKSISNVKVAGVKVADADRTINLDDNGKSTISFTSKNLLKNQGAHSHGTMINEEYRPTGASFTYDAGMGASGVAANLKDLDDSTFCHVGLTGAVGSAKDAYFTVTFPTYTGQTPDAVYACISCDWNLGSLANEYFKITAPEMIAIGVQGYSSGKYLARIKLTGTSVPGTLTCRAHTDAGNPVNLIVNVYEMWIELEFSNIPSGGEHSVWEKLAPLVTCDVEGYKDDGSGTYTGTANALIENPSDVRRYILQGIVGRSASEIGASFNTMRTTYAGRAGGYKFGVNLPILGRSLSEIFQKFDEQSRSHMREDGGKFELSFNDTAEPSSVLTIDKTIYIDDPVFSQTPEVNIRNVIRAVFDYDWSGVRQGRLGNFQKQIETPNLNGQRMLANFDGTHGQTSFTDPYGNVFTGYNSAIISTVAQKFGTASIRLPGTGGRFDVPSIPLNQFTIEFFWRMDNKLTDNQMFCQGITDYRFRILYHGATSRIHFNLRDEAGTGWDTAQLGSKVSWANNTWYHLEFSFDGYTYRIFIDGVLDVSYIKSRIIDAISGIRLGAYSVSYCLTGYIDEFRFTPYCLHTANFTPPAAPYSPVILGEELPEDVEFLAVQSEPMASDVAEWIRLQKHDVIPMVSLHCNRRARILERGDYFTLNDCPVAVWEGSKWKVLEIHEIPERQRFEIRAIQHISS